MKINTKIRKARELTGLTQVQVAEKAKIPERVYQYYESGKREPKARMAVRIAKALNTTVERLFSVAEDETISHD